MNKIGEKLIGMVLAFAILFGLFPVIEAIIPETQELSVVVISAFFITLASQYVVNRVFSTSSGTTTRPQDENKWMRNRIISQSPNPSEPCPRCGGTFKQVGGKRFLLKFKCIQCERSAFSTRKNITNVEEKSEQCIKLN